MKWKQNPPPKRHRTCWQRRAEAVSGIFSDPHIARHTYSDSYYVPNPSRWPLLTSLSATALVTGFLLMIYSITGGTLVMLIGLLGLLGCMYGWWSDVAFESEGGRYRIWEDMSFRWGMLWFIFSEVMFFAVFFGVLFYSRAIVLPDLAAEHSKIVWPDFLASWPTKGPYQAIDFKTIPAFGVPAINTLVLLSSGVTVTWAHWALKLDKRWQLVIGLALTALLGAIFVALQAAEYIHAYSELNLKLTSGIYGSTFFLLTGFHGLHVTLGTAALTVILVRCLRGHFSSDHHFGFEAVAWYWHFVDVIWLMLFVVVYWL